MGSRKKRRRQRQREPADFARLFSSLKREILTGIGADDGLLLRDPDGPRALFVLELETIRLLRVNHA